MVRAQLCPTLCNPKDRGPPGSSVHGIFPARTLEWVAISYSRASFWPQGLNLCLLHWQVILHHCATQEVETSTPTNALSSMGVSPKQHSPGSHWRRLRGAGGGSQLMPRSVCPITYAQVHKTSWASWQMMVGPTTPTETLLFTDGCQTITIKTGHRKEGYLLHPWYWPHT